MNVECGMELSITLHHSAFCIPHSELKHRL